MKLPLPFRRLTACLGALLLLASSLIPANAGAAEAAASETAWRDQARDIIRDARRIVAPTGIEETRAVKIGGVDQWINVRGRDSRNPILLFIHGGPASTEMPVSWLYQSAWEDFFTVVQWDQRVAGKTGATTPDNEAVLKTIDIERMTQDGLEMVEHLRRQYGKDRIFVLAHSWGSVMGMNIAHRRPEWLHAYIGMGQIIDWKDNERVGYEFALREAKRDGNAKAVAALEAIAPYPPADGVVPFESIITQRTWVIHYGGLTANRSNFDYDLNARKISPEYTDKDLKNHVKDGSVLIELLPDLAGVDYDKIRELKTPVFFFAGKRDFQTPSELAAAWIAKVKAPQKGIFWFEKSAHMMHLEQPGKVLMHLVNDIRPIAVRAGDVAPPDQPGAAR